jgi:hypothetical protein
MLSVAIAAAQENNGVPSVKDRRRRKFTPDNIAKIKDWVANGVGRDEIANRLGATVGSLQVTCSRLGISLRKNSFANGNGAIQPPRVVRRSIEHIRHVDDPARPKFKLLMQKQGREAEVDLPLHQGHMEQLALEASVRGEGIADLIRTILSQVVRKDLVGELLRNGDSTSKDFLLPGR